MEGHSLVAWASLRDAKDGLAAVEFALLAPILMLIFAGAASLGFASWTRMEVGNAARAGAAYAANHIYNPLLITAAAQNATALSNVTVTPMLLTSYCTDPASGEISPSNGAATCPGTGTAPGTYVTVATKTSYAFMLPIPGIAGPTTLSGSAVTRIQ